MACRVLKIARQPYYRWLKNPVPDAELAEAYRANALFDAHREDPSVRLPLPRRRGRSRGREDVPADGVADLLGRRLDQRHQ